MVRMKAIDVRFVVVMSSLVFPTNWLGSGDGEATLS